MISNKPRLHTKKNYSYDKNPQSFCYEQKYMSLVIETIIVYWCYYSSSSKFSSAAHLDDFFVAQDAFHNTGNILH